MNKLTKKVLRVEIPALERLAVRSREDSPSTSLHLLALVEELEQGEHQHALTNLEQLDETVLDEVSKLAPGIWAWLDPENDSQNN